MTSSLRTTAAASLLCAGLLATTGCGSHKAAAPATPTSVRVRIVNFSFSPATVTVRAGGTVTWIQVDQVGHSVVSDNHAWAPSAILRPGQTFSHTFPTAGTYSYICGVHTYMTGTVKVVG